MNTNLHEKVQIKDNIPARGICYSSTNQLVTNHWHNSLELIVITEGIMEVGIGDDTYHLHENEMIIIDSGAIHYTQVIGYTTVYAIQIPYHIMQNHIPNYEYSCFRSKNNSILFEKNADSKNLKELIVSYNKLSSEKPAGYSLRCSSILYEIIYHLYMNYMVEIDRSLKGKNDWHMNRVKQVISYINQNYTQALSLSDGAELLSLNPEYFCRYFKKYTGYTFLDYVNTTRLTHIANDLQHTSASVTDLTEKHGFTNYKLFLKMFRKTYGCTPSEYRKKSIKNRQR